MLHRTLIVLLAFLFASGDGKKEGNRGNSLYEKERYEEASAAYLSGLAALEEDAPAALRYGLLNNLGAALHKQGNTEEAAAALRRALDAAPGDAAYARTAYNAGNNAFAGKQLEQALDYYKRALLSDPANEDAKFNYEYVKRQLDQQQQQQNQDGQNDQQQDQQQNDQQDQNQDGENEQQQNEQQQQQNQDGENEQQQDQQDPQQNQEPREDGEQEQQRQPDPNKLSQAQAERILQALENEEEQLLREIQKPKSRGRQVKKDW